MYGEEACKTKSAYYCTYRLRPAILLKNRLRYRYSCQFCKNFKNTFFIEHFQGLLLSNNAKLEEKNKTYTYQKWIKGKAKQQLETILIIRDIQGRKNVNVIYKDLVSWAAFSIWCVRSHAHTPAHAPLVWCVWKIACTKSNCDTFCSGLKMFRLLTEFRLFCLNLYLFLPSNYNSNVNYFCNKLFTLKANIFLNNYIMELLHLLRFPFCICFVKGIW